MDKKWGYDVPSVDIWREALRVLKPGGHLLSFGGTRTYHRMVVAIEDAGFEIRDQIQWIYGSGFPKSHNLPGGIGTALKPANEPIVLARKPLEGTVAKNIAKWGVGGLNIDESRVETKPANPIGRWPANVLFDEAAAEQLDMQSGVLHSRGNINPTTRGGGMYGHKAFDGTIGFNDHAKDQGASRFFYCAKSSKSERNAGLEFNNVSLTKHDARPQDWENADWKSRGGNHHPTVKPIKLMQYLIKLITPPGGIVLDPFMGSGSTGVACKQLGYEFVGIEMNEEYVEIAKRRCGIK